MSAANPLPADAECALCHRVDPEKGLHKSKDGTVRCSSTHDCQSIVRRRLINAATSGED